MSKNTPMPAQTWTIENVEISANGLRVTYARSDGHKIIGYHTKFATLEDVGLTLATLQRETP